LISELKANKGIFTVSYNELN